MSNEDRIRVPSYCLHKATGRAVVTLAGTDVYLGKFGSAASRKEYRRLVGEWLASDGTSPLADAAEITIAEMLRRYRRFAERHYRPRPGSRTNELANMAHAIRPLREIYGHTLVKDFGPLALKALQQHLVSSQLSRRTVNSRINRIRRVFRWAVSEELAGASLAHALDTVPGLRYGRSEARETEPVKPVSDAAVEATLTHLAAVVADMVRFQRLTGCRPAEACIVRPCDVSTAGDVWEYRPAAHKTQHHGHERVVFIGPKAQDVLRSYLLRSKTDYCFSPVDSEHERRAELHAAQKRPYRAEIDRERTSSGSPSAARDSGTTPPLTCAPSIARATKHFPCPVN